MSNEKKINVKLLRRVKALILEEPRRFNMSLFAFTKREIEAYVPDVDERPPCGTMACIAGWAVFLVDGAPSRITPTIYQSIEVRAKELLGLDDRTARELFLAGNWPEEFANAYEDAETPTERARVAAKRIERFIRTKGAE